MPGIEGHASFGFAVGEHNLRIGVEIVEEVFVAAFGVVQAVPLYTRENSANSYERYCLVKLSVALKRLFSFPKPVLLLPIVIYAGLLRAADDSACVAVVKVMPPAAADFQY